MLLISQLTQNIFYTVIFPHLEIKIKKGIVTELYEKVKTIEAAAFDDSSFYDGYTRALNEADKRAVDMLNTLSDFVTNVLQIAVLTLTLVYFSPFIIVIAVLGMLTVIWANIVNTKKWYEYDMEKTRSTRHFDYIKRIFYMQQYVKDVKITGISKLLLKKYNEQAIILKDIVSKYPPPYSGCRNRGKLVI
jgi:ATP-binding cassette subfamily B protein